MKQSYFVTGTDTGIGKTTVSCALLRAFAGQGRRVVGMKPVASGCRREGGRLVCDDVQQLQAASNVAAPLELVNPYAFEPPVSPNIAAEQSGSVISTERISAAFASLQAAADTVIVEGVGGFCVPLSPAQDTADMALQLGLPVILVVGLRLGCLNHALLTAQVVQSRGLVLAGWVANLMHAEPMLAQSANIATLRQRLPAPYLGLSVYQPLRGMAYATNLLDLQKLNLKQTS